MADDTKNNPAKSLAEIRREMLKLVTSGELTEAAQTLIFKDSGYTYGSSPRGPEFVDRIYRDGRRVTGRLTPTGEFEEIE